MTDRSLLIVRGGRHAADSAFSCIAHTPEPNQYVAVEFEDGVVAKRTLYRGSQRRELERIANSGAYTSVFADTRTDPGLLPFSYPKHVTHADLNIFRRAKSDDEIHRLQKMESILSASVRTNVDETHFRGVVDGLRYRHAMSSTPGERFSLKRYGLKDDSGLEVELTSIQPHTSDWEERVVRIQRGCDAVQSRLAEGVSVADLDKTFRSALNPRIDRVYGSVVHHTGYDAWEDGIELDAIQGYDVVTISPIVGDSDGYWVPFMHSVHAMHDTGYRGSGNDVDAYERLFRSSHPVSDIDDKMSPEEVHIKLWATVMYVKMGNMESSLSNPFPNHTVMKQFFTITRSPGDGNSPTLADVDTTIKTVFFYLIAGIFAEAVQSMNVKIVSDFWNMITTLDKSPHPDAKTDSAQTGTFKQLEMKVKSLEFVLYHVWNEVYNKFDQIHEWLTRNNMFHPHEETVKKISEDFVDVLNGKDFAKYSEKQKKAIVSQELPPLTFENGPTTHALMWTATHPKLMKFGYKDGYDVIESVKYGTVTDMITYVNATDVNMFSVPTTNLFENDKKNVIQRVTTTIQNVLPILMTPMVKVKAVQKKPFMFLLGIDDHSWELYPSLMNKVDDEGKIDLRDTRYEDEKKHHMRQMRMPDTIDVNDIITSSFMTSNMIYYDHDDIDTKFDDEKARMIRDKDVNENVEKLWKNAFTADNENAKTTSYIDLFVRGGYHVLNTIMTNLPESGTDTSGTKVSYYVPSLDMYATSEETTPIKYCLHVRIVYQLGLAPDMSSRPLTISTNDEDFKKVSSWNGENDENETVTLKSTKLDIVLPVNKPVLIVQTTSVNEITVPIDWVHCYPAYEFESETKDVIQTKEDLHKFVNEMRFLGMNKSPDPKYLEKLLRYGVHIVVYLEEMAKRADEILGYRYTALKWFTAHVYHKHFNNRPDFQDYFTQVDELWERMIRNIPMAAPASMPSMSSRHEGRACAKPVQKKNNPLPQSTASMKP